MSDEKIGEIAERIIAETDEKDEKELLSKAEKSKSLAEKDDDDDDNSLVANRQQVNIIMDTKEIIKQAEKNHNGKTIKGKGSNSALAQKPTKRRFLSEAF